MLCKSPFIRDRSGRLYKAAILSNEAFKATDLGKDLLLSGQPFPCGQCLPCRINKRRVWTHRLMLEGFCHPSSLFVTLTYSPEFLPEGGTLVKRHLQLFFKRLRKSLSPLLFRYYAVGEYGERYSRPHYHLILFGLSQSHVAAVRRAWIDPETGSPIGLVHVGSGQRLSYQYVAGYVTKKYVKKSDNFVPEFATMSRRPGIGYPALEKVQLLMNNPVFQKMVHIDQDVPKGLMHGQKWWPFGRYLVEKLRQMIESGWTDEKWYAEIRQKYVEHLASCDERVFFERMQDETKQQIINLEAKERLFAQKRRFHAS